jgi:hypothetical protein
MVEGCISSSGQVIVHDDEDLYCRGVLHLSTHQYGPTWAARGPGFSLPSPMKRASTRERENAGLYPTQPNLSSTWNFLNTMTPMTNLVVCCVLSHGRIISGRSGADAKRISLRYRPRVVRGPSRPHVMINLEFPAIT